MTIAVIGGTGLAALPSLEILKTHAVDTPFGTPTAPIEEGTLSGTPVYFLHRHGGRGQPVPPHLVNYRANVWALRELGASLIIAVNAVGAITPSLSPGRLTVPDQLIDYTWGREHSFDDGSSGQLQHIDFTEPYDQGLRTALLTAAASVGVPCANSAVLAVVQGPRLETAAEVRRLAGDGCDLVGMTGMPEAALARELALPYAALCMTVNAAAGLTGRAIDIEEILRVIANEVELVARVLAEVIPAFEDYCTAPSS